jgi:hypothetical protein
MYFNILIFDDYNPIGSLRRHTDICDKFLAQLTNLNEKIFYENLYTVFYAIPTYRK